MLWSGLDSRVGTSHRVNLIAPLPLGQELSKKITINYKLSEMIVGKTAIIVPSEKECSSGTVLSLSPL